MDFKSKKRFCGLFISVFFSLLVLANLQAQEESKPKSRPVTTGRLNLGIGTELEITKLYGAGETSTGAEAKTENLIPLDFLVRYTTSGDFALGITLRAGIGWPDTFDWYGPLPLLIFDSGYYSFSQSQKGLWTFEKDGGADLLEINAFVGVAAKKRIAGAFSLVFDAGVAVHHTSANWNMFGKSDDESSDWTYGSGKTTNRPWLKYDDDNYYDEINVNLSDTSIGIAGFIGVNANFGMLYFEVGAGVAYDFLHTINGTVKLKDSTGNYSKENEITYGEYNARTESISLLTLTTPYFLVGVSF